MDLIQIKFNNGPIVLVLLYYCIGFAFQNTFISFNSKIGGAFVGGRFAAPSFDRKLISLFMSLTVEIANGKNIKKEFLKIN